MIRFLLPFGLTLATLPLAAQTPQQNSSSQKSSSQNSTSQSRSQARSAGDARSSMGGAKGHRSREVSDLLSATSDARVAAQDNNKEDALFHVNHALEISNRLSTGNTSNERYVPLYEELDQYSVVGPIVSHRSANNGNTNTSNTNITNSNRPGVVQNVRGAFTAAMFDTQQAKDHLTAAKQALKQGEFQKADAALAAVQDGIVVASVSADLPLIQARENLILAREAADRGDYRQAHASIQAASDALVTYQSGGGRHAGEVNALRTQMDNYNRTIQENHSDADSKLDAWWEQISDWTTQPSKG